MVFIGAFFLLTGGFGFGIFLVTLPRQETTSPSSALPVASLVRGMGEGKGNPKGKLYE